MGAANLARRDEGRSFVTVEAQEHEEKAGVGDAELIVDGVELPIEGHLVAAVWTGRHSFLLEASGLSTELVTSTDIWIGPAKRGESLRIRRERLRNKAKWGDVSWHWRWSG